MAPQHEAPARALYDHERDEPRGRRRTVADWGVGEDIFDRMPSRRFTRADRRAEHHDDGGRRDAPRRDDVAPRRAVESWIGGDEPRSAVEPRPVVETLAGWDESRRAAELRDEPRRAVESWADEVIRRDRALASQADSAPGTAADNGPGRRKRRPVESWFDTPESRTIVIERSAPAGGDDFAHADFTAAGRDDFAIERSARAGGDDFTRAGGNDFAYDDFTPASGAGFAAARYDGAPVVEQVADAWGDRSVARAPRGYGDEAHDRGGSGALAPYALGAPYGQDEALGGAHLSTNTMDAAARPRRAATPSGRRTVVISGHPDRPLVPRAQRPPRTALDRLGGSPDRIVAYAVALGFLLVLIAVLTTGQ